MRLRDLAEHPKENQPFAPIRHSASSRTYDTNSSLQVTWQKVAYSVVEIGETDQILTVSVECSPMYDSTNGVISAVAKCGTDNICQ